MIAHDKPLYSLTVGEYTQLTKDLLSSFKPNKKEEETDEIGGIDLAMRITGLAKQTIYDKTAKHLIPHSKIGGKKIIFRKSQLLQWIDENRILTDKEELKQTNQFIINSKRNGSRQKK